MSLNKDDVRMLRMAMHKLELFSEAPEFRMVRDSIGRLSDFFNLSGADQDDKTDKYILFQYSKGFRGKEFLSAIYDAIFECKEISFMHCKYESDDPTFRTLQPYTLKEHRNRWYVIGKENGNPRIFGLDRMSELKVREVYFIREPEFYDEIFNVLKDAVGVMAFDFKSEDVILEFTEEQSYYIRSLMLHRSQTLVEKPDGGVIVHLHVKITPEFITECILKYGDGVKVIKPQSLVKQIREIYANALTYYK
jgi:predicted DNA-binding transcriptional regulator YafY